MLDENLQLNSTGDNVKILQEKLKILGFYNAIVTGIYGLATEVGVRAFQKEYNLEETGIVDNETWQLLFELTEVAVVPYSNMPILSLGSTGGAVSDLQTKLSALLYYTGPVTSKFDLETENAVKRFQYNNDLTTTGVVNNQTWNLIDYLYGTLNDCVIGDNNQENGYLSYVVKSGDTLYAIASRYGTTVDAIKSLNNLTSNTLSVGQVLKIPSSNNGGSTENYVSYVVKSGDTLYAIASRYGTTVDAIKSLNNLTSNTLSVGQVLKIPSSNNGGNTENYVSYVVKSGDTLYAIASRYGTTVDAIKNFNNLTSNTLSIGQVLNIPTTTGGVDNYISYIVTRGDTLYAIASRYNTTVDVLKRINNLTSNILSVGQILRIPI